VHRNRFLFNKTNRRTNFPNLFCQETLRVPGSSSAHHQEFSSVHSALVYVMQFWWQLSSTAKMEQSSILVSLDFSVTYFLPTVPWPWSWL